jgi:hypothetical protein
MYVHKSSFSRAVPLRSWRERESVTYNWREKDRDQREIREGGSRQHDNIYIYIYIYIRYALSYVQPLCSALHAGPSQPLEAAFQLLDIICIYRRVLYI